LQYKRYYLPDAENALAKQHVWQEGKKKERFNHRFSQIDTEVKGKRKKLL
jgi:hypothetical protein